jgi:hypothetical protein
MDKAGMKSKIPPNLINSELTLETKQVQQGRLLITADHQPMF